MYGIEIITTDVAVVGSGAAGYHAAVRVKQEGKKQVLLVTEGVFCGTSRNTGSDKQTYYKQGLGGDRLDSVRKMAEDLFAGGSVDGDNALCEAALSARCFFHLCELGVPFPVNRYGEYIGYKTDHDPYARATSAGPLTSRYMTEALQKRAAELEVDVYDGFLAVEILKDNDGVCGLLCLEKDSGKLIAIHCSQVILATGGPAGIYADSVYPEGHTGSTALAIRAGAALQNLTEWQYGLASVSPRWNVSGTYMQVLPRFVSVDEDGCEREFLAEAFLNPYEALSAVFLKGYQWPFDCKKAENGSSVIDLLVYRECVERKRTVYLDYTQNPFGLQELDFEQLSEEAYAYLKKADACFGTPIERLKKMNQPAIELYRSKGRNLEREYLEIALCAQHHNGGIAVDAWWQTTVPGLFAVGECAGTHGVTRPGGSALNAGQVGALRAAQYCSVSDRVRSDLSAFQLLVHKHAMIHEEFCRCMCIHEENASEKIAQSCRRMSDCGAAIRECSAMYAALEEIRKECAHFLSDVGVADEENLVLAYKLSDILTVQSAVLTAMIDFYEKTGSNRGSALYMDHRKDGVKPEICDSEKKIQQICMDESSREYRITWREVRPIPVSDDFFENVWKQYRENKNIF